MRIRAAVLEAIAAHARAASPEECCGLLIGHDGHINEAIATENVAADRRGRYQVSPADYFAQIRRCRTIAAAGTPLAVVGAYHSHPRGAPEPSPTDLEEAFEDFVFIIAGPVSDDTALEVRGYRLRDGRLKEIQLEESG
jgi:proteasome lid subunit RPN8/RPN11